MGRSQTIHRGRGQGHHRQKEHQQFVKPSASQAIPEGKGRKEYEDY
jgi:hypothetical protein